MAFFLDFVETVVQETGVGELFEEVTGYGIEGGIAKHGLNPRLNFNRHKRINSSDDVEELLLEINRKLLEYDQVKEAVGGDPLQMLKEKVPEDVWNCVVDLISEIIPTGTSLEVDVKSTTDSEPSIRVSPKTFSNKYEIRYKQLIAKVTMCGVTTKEVEKRWQSLHLIPRKEREGLLKNGNILTTADGKKLELSEKLSGFVRSDLKNEISLMSYILPMVYGKNNKDERRDKRKKILMAGKLIMAILRHPHEVMDTSVKYLDDTEAYEIAEDTEESLREKDWFYPFLYGKEAMTTLISKTMKQELDEKQKDKIDEVTRTFEERLTVSAFNTNHLHIKRDWDEIKKNTSTPRYKMMGELSQLKTFSQSNDETLYRFSLQEPDVKLPFEDKGASFAFVFALKDENPHSLRKLVRSVSFMFSDQAQEVKDEKGQKVGTQTVDQCFEWAQDESNDMRNLTYTKENKQCELCWVKIRSNAAVTREGVCSAYFSEGILHKRAYKTTSKGYDVGKLV